MKKGLCVFAGGAILVFLMSAEVERSAAGAGSQSQARAGQLTHLGDVSQAMSALQQGAQQAPAIRSISPSSPKIKVDADYGKMPVYFIPNRGQMDKQVAYYVQGEDKSLYFTDEGVTIALTKPVPSKQVKLEVSKVPGYDRPMKTAGERWVLRLDFVGAVKGVKPVGEDETGAVVSYFKGKQKDRKAGLPTYSKIIYRDLWPGIDLVYHGTVNRLKYEFVVHPGADPASIRLAYRGVDGLLVDDAGRLNVMTPAGGFQDDVPVAYQVKNGKRIGIGLAYELETASAARHINIAGGAQPDQKISIVPTSGKGQVSAVHVVPVDERAEITDSASRAYSFKVGDFDSSLPLILDPATLVYCGYIGGTSLDSGNGIAVDAARNVYIAGETSSNQTGFPVAVGPDLTFNGGSDVFVAKLNPAGTALIYCGYIGGTPTIPYSGSDIGLGIAVDSGGNAYVIGSTNSTEATFPVTVGPDLS
jgi:hypothetical protein